MLVIIVRYLLCFFIFALVPVKIFTQPVNQDDARILVDQRQSGKYNIHLSIKDVAIIEMDRNDFQDNTVNDDYYYYDEGDLTVKPISAWFTTTSTTAKTTTVNTTSMPEVDTGSGSSESAAITTLSGEDENLTTIYLPSQSPPRPINVSIKPEQLQFPSPTTTRPPLTTSKKTNVVILDPSSTFLPPLKNEVTTHSLLLYNHSLSHLSQPTPPSETQSMQAILEPVLRPKQRGTPKHSLLNSHNSHMRFRPAVRIMPPMSSGEHQLDDSRIFNFKARRSSPSSFRGRCRQGHYRDADGNCRVKRSSSILKRLFSMLTSLPINDIDEN